MDYSPSPELKNSVFVGKIFYKANALANVSLGYVDHVEKIPHLSHMGKHHFQALFLNDACAIWWKSIFPNIDLLYILF